MTPFRIIMKSNVRIMLVLALTACGAVLFAQAPVSIWSGIYSTAQATRGEALYAKNCSSCHATDLMGSGQAPELAGPEFRKEWDGQTMGDLYDRMSLTMPADRPNALPNEEVAAILAFILKSNGYPAGKTDLKGDPDLLRNIVFEATREKK
jgi:S-disulfanyl-L-cysteine oxidoreductase SoxD